MNKSEEELEKERLKNLLLFKMYLTDEEIENMPVSVVVITVFIIVIVIIAIAIYYKG